MVATSTRCATELLVQLHRGKIPPDDLQLNPAQRCLSQNVNRAGAFPSIVGMAGCAPKKGSA